nr:ribonuclease p protein subunit drpp30 [Quercus suber]
MTKCYIFHPNTSRHVTSRYLEWWKQSKLGKQDAVKGVSQHQIISNDSKRSSEYSTGRIIDDNDSTPPHSPPKCNQFEAMNPDQEENSTVKEQLRSFKRDGRMVGNGKPLLDTKSDVPSQSTAHDGKVIKTEALTEFDKNMQSEPLVGESKRVMEEWNESKEGRPEFSVEGLNRNEGESSSSCIFELPGSNLEARISKLEKLVSKLKEARGGNKFEKNPINGGLTKPLLHYAITWSLKTDQTSLALNSGNPVLKTYDLVAVKPLDQTVFDDACDKSEVDIIAIDFSERLPFRLKQAKVKAAIEAWSIF